VSELDGEFERERNRFYDNMIWDIADDDDWDKSMEKKPFFKKLKDKRYYRRNKEDLDALFKKLVETTAKTFHIHVSGDLNKLDVEKLIKFA
jgi:hypothetical protein